MEGSALRGHSAGRQVVVTLLIWSQSGLAQAGTVQRALSSALTRNDHATFSVSLVPAEGVPIRIGTRLVPAAVESRHRCPPAQLSWATDEIRVRVVG